MNKKKKITVRVPKQMQENLFRAIVDDGYKMRGKSLWVNEAIENFLKMEFFVDYVDIGSEVGDGELLVTESFYLPITTIDYLEQAVVEIRKQYPKIEGVKSIIIRSSILQRLFRPKKKQVV